MGDVLHNFYCSKDWRDLSFRLKVERGFKDEVTGEIFTEASEVIADHDPIELTEENVMDPNISLNPDNIKIRSFDNHNKKHRRFGYNQKHVYIVYGSPLSGKTTLVRELMQKGDMVIDIDHLWMALTMNEKYIKPNELKQNIFQIRNELINQVRRRFGNWIDAYIIGSYPNKIEREKLAASLRAELIHCESSREECLKRFRESNRPTEYEDYINKFWDDYHL